MSLVPTSARERKRVDMSLFGITSLMGVVQSGLEKLLAGQAGVSITKKLGVSRMDLKGSSRAR
jgi:hypothetical protein